MLLKASKIALAQTTAVLGDVPKNVAHHAEMCKGAIAQKADAIIFPELSLSGYTVRDLNFESSLKGASDPLLKPLLDLSDQITIVCGGVVEDQRGAVYNAALLIEDGEVRH